ncbi:MAG: DUF4382 domain-containing protein [Bdellovibrionales bacterium]|nr:DUF4382 domain-containing protein [Bdellovibrionales bacterium]
MVKKILLFTGLIFAFGCNDSTNNNQTVNANKYSEKPSNFKIHLTDAPIDQVKEVHVNVKHIELWLKGQKNSARVKLAEDFGDVDLLKLQNGITLAMADLDIPQNVEVTHFRLILNSEGNYLIYDNDDLCALQTPSQQKTGLKIKFGAPVRVESNRSYTLTVDFDAKKSIVIKGNGGCLLKPVLKLANLDSTPLDNVNEDGSTIDPDREDEELDPGNSTQEPTTDEPATDTEDSSSNDDGETADNNTNEEDEPYDWSTYDPSDPSTWPEYVDPDNLDGLN